LFAFLVGAMEEAVAFGGGREVERGGPAQAFEQISG